MSLPTVSVVIPAYNQADFIEACLDSVAAQSWAGDVEVVVVDDGSTDDTAARAEAHKLSPKVLRQQNAGVSGARNTGIEASTGDWVAFLDADDRWTPKKLTRQMEALLQLKRPALSFCRYRRVTPRGEVIANNAEHPQVDLQVSARRLLRHNFIGTSTVVVHRQCLTRCGGFPDSQELLGGGQDYALWLRIAAYFPLLYVPEVGMLYTVHEQNRVGVDPTGHHRGALHALKDFSQWDEDRFRALAKGSFESLVALRTASFVVDALRFPEHFPRGSVRRALSTSLKVAR